MWAADDVIHDEDDHEDERALPEHPRALDAMLRTMVHEMTTEDLSLGAMASEISASGGWAALGYASFDQWGRERLGIGRSTLRQKMKLAREAERLPELGDAIRRGFAGAEDTALLMRVADHKTVAAWLERRGRRTYKHLREEVEVAERRATPPNDAELAHAFAEERAVLSGELLKNMLSESRVPLCEHAERRPAPTTRQVRFRIPVDSFIEFRMMEVAFERAGLTGTFVRFLCRQFWSIWLPTLGTSDKWEHIYRRDRYRCTCPVCVRRDLTLHHIRYRSAGGGDEDENLASICFFNHLEGEHAGRLHFSGPANHMTWRLGRTSDPPTLVVVGRELVAG
jgi:hypothetical protein